jgi:tetratricopeptide (TPR) repeat protein
MRNCSLLFFCLFSFVASALSPISLFKDANQAYQKGDFQKSITLYEQIKGDHRVASVELLYNLGNAYYRLGDYPSAVLNYERALKENPSDREVLANLQITRNKLEDKIEPMPELFYIRWFKVIRNAFSTDAWAWLFIFSLVGSAALWIMFVQSNKSRNKKAGFYGGLLSFVLSILLFITAFSSWESSYKTQRAVVFAGSISVKSAPVISGNGLFIIHAGTTVSITDELGEWVRIRLVDGKEGWVILGDLEVI